MPPEQGKQTCTEICHDAAKAMEAQVLAMKQAMEAQFNAKLSQLDKAEKQRVAKMKNKEAQLASKAKELEEEARQVGRRTPEVPVVAAGRPSTCDNATRIRAACIASGLCRDCLASPGATRTWGRRFHGM